VRAAAVRKRSLAPGEDLLNLASHDVENSFSTESTRSGPHSARLPNYRNRLKTKLRS